MDGSKEPPIFFMGFQIGFWAGWVDKNPDRFFSLILKAPSASLAVMR